MLLIFSLFLYKIIKIKNAFQSLKKQEIIVVEGKLWKMSKQDELDLF